MILLAPVSKQPKSSFDFERSRRRCPQLLILELIAPRWPERGRLLCRFSDAGMTRLSTHCGGRRPKSAKARNRGKWGTGGAARALWRFNRAATMLAGKPHRLNGRTIVRGPGAMSVSDIVLL